MSNNETFIGTLCKETRAAILFDDGFKKVWLPKASITITELSDRRTAPRPIEAHLPLRLAKEKGFYV